LIRDRGRRGVFRGVRGRRSGRWVMPVTWTPSAGATTWAGTGRHFGPARQGGPHPPAGTARRPDPRRRAFGRPRWKTIRTEPGLVRKDDGQGRILFTETSRRSAGDAVPGAAPLSAGRTRQVAVETVGVGRGNFQVAGGAEGSVGDTVSGDTVSVAVESVSSEVLARAENGPERFGSAGFFGDRRSVFPGFRRSTKAEKSGEFCGQRGVHGDDDGRGEERVSVEYQPWDFGWGCGRMAGLAGMIGAWAARPETRGEGTRARS